MNTERTIRIEGMSCASCATHVRDALLKQTGVTDARVDYRAGLATVTLSDGSADESSLRRSIESAGYRVTGAFESQAKTNDVSGPEIANAPMAGETRRKTGRLSSLWVLPGIGATLLPVGVCPVCWAAYAGLLSTLGLGFLLKTAYLLPVTILFLLIAVGTLAVRAGSRRGYGPFIVGLAACGVILIGKFALLSDVAMYSGVGLLVAAALWNAWPLRATGVNDGACPACASSGQVPDSQQPGAKEASS